MRQGCTCEQYSAERVYTPGSRESPGKHSARSPSSPLRGSPAQKTALRNLIEQKEREINEASDQRIRILESRVIELQEALARCDSEKTSTEAKLLGLGRDFDYNLKLLEERDFEIDRLEGIVKGLKNAAEGSEQTMGSTRRRLQDLEAEQLTWKKAERDLKWRIEQLEGRAKDAAAQHLQELQRLEDESAEQIRRAEEEMERLRDELMQERADLCSGYEQKLQQALMAEEDLQATVARQNLELVEAARKAEDVEIAQNERDARTDELGGVIQQFENAVTALQELEEKHSQLVTEHSQLRVDKDAEIKALERQIEELKQQDTRRVSHFESKVHELARAQESVEAAYQLSQQESSSMEERLQDSLRQATAEAKKFKHKLKESEARVMRLAKEAEHFKVVADQQRDLTEQTRSQGEALRQELHDKIAALARLQEQVMGLERRQLELKGELKAAGDAGAAAIKERDDALARSAQAEQKARLARQKAVEEQRRSLELAQEYLDASQDLDGHSSANIRASHGSAGLLQTPAANQPHESDNRGSVEGLLSSLASDNAKFADDLKNWTPLGKASAQPKNGDPLRPRDIPQEEAPMAMSAPQETATNAELVALPAPPEAAPPPKPKQTGPGTPVASASPPLRSAALQSSSARLQLRRRQWEEEEARLREQREAKLRGIQEKELQERESRRRAAQDEAVKMASQRRMEAEAQRQGQTVEFLKIKANQLSAENQRLRRQMAEAQAQAHGQAGGAGWGRPVQMPGSSAGSAADLRPQAPGYFADQASRLSASGGSLLGASQGGPTSPGGSLLGSSISANADPPLRRHHHYARPVPGSAATKSYDPADRASNGDSLLDRSDVHVHVNVYDSSADEVNVSCSSPIRDRSNASSPLRPAAAAGPRSGMSFRIRSPDRGSEPMVELYSAPPMSLEAGESIERARELILDAKAEIERAQMEEPAAGKGRGNLRSGAKRSGQRKAAGIRSSSRR